LDIAVPLVLLIIGRDVALIISAFLIRYRSLPEPKTFSRYWDPRLPSAKVEPTQISKYNTFLQLVLVAGCTLIASFNENWRQWWSEKQGLWSDAEGGDKVKESASQGNRALDWGDWTKKSWHAFMVLVSFTTVWSGSSYLFASKGVRYLGQKAKSTQEQVMKLRK
jgi:cardiolipin synthase